MNAIARIPDVILRPMTSLLQSAMGSLSTRKGRIIRNHLLHKILAIPANQCGCGYCLEGIGAFRMRTEK